MEMSFRPVHWEGWKRRIKNSQIHPFEGRDTTTGSKVIVFPTVAITGEALHGLSRLSIPVKVVAGFQSDRRLSSVEIEGSDGSDLFIKTGKDRRFTITMPGELVDAAARTQCLQQGLAKIAAQNRSALSTFIRSTAHALNNYAIGILGSFEIMGMVSFDAKRALKLIDWNLTYDQSRDIFNMAREEKPWIDNRVRIAVAGIQQLKAWFERVEQTLVILTDFNDDNLMGDIDSARCAVIEAKPFIMRTLDVLYDLGQLSVLSPMCLMEPIFLQQLIKDLLPERKDVFSCKILGNPILLCEIFEEMVSNAKRATGKRELEGVRLEIDVLEKSGEIKITLINEVHDSEMRRFAEQVDKLFDLAVDPFDGFEKQRIFHQGVSSRSVGGGTGLAVVWERGVLNLHGKVEADYHPKQNEFSLAVCLRLVQDK